MHLVATIAAVAIAAGGGVVGITLATRQNPPHIHAQSGKPPMPKNLQTPAAAQIRQAFAEWPHGSIPELMKLQLQYPKDPVGYAWAGYDSAAVQPLKAAEKYGYDTPIEVNAELLLNPQDAPVNPVFQVSGSEDALVHQGDQLEFDGHLHSAEKLFAQAARLHPNDPEDQAAAAFGLFDKDNPSVAFAKLGPLAKRFPQSQSVHFNLGYLLVVIGKTSSAEAQFRRTVALGPKTILGVTAQRFLTAIQKAGASGGTASAAK
jgi:tetratricopeptide (TPR) repeat protein